VKVCAIKLLILFILV